MRPPGILGIPGPDFPLDGLEIGLLARRLQFFAAPAGPFGGAGAYIDADGSAQRLPRLWVY